MKQKKKLIEQAYELQKLYKERVAYVQTRHSIHAQMKALVSAALNQRVVSAAQVKDEVRATLKRGTPCTLLTLNATKDILDAGILRVEVKMKIIVRTTPIWNEWAKYIKGIGEVTIGNIIGGSVCGGRDPLARRDYPKKYITIGDYDNPSKLWKRWGLAVYKGSRQPGKYTNSTRRRIIWQVGNVLVKQGRYYKQRYDQEKARQLDLYPVVLETKYGKETKNNLAQARAHNRAMRYITKLFLQDLWNKWREIYKVGEFHVLSIRRD